MINERKTCQRSDLKQGPFTPQSLPLPGHYDFITICEGINNRIALQEGGWWPPPVVWNRQDITLCRIGLRTNHKPQTPQEKKVVQRYNV